jgi:MFS superfamily sulfate permease-like transporter
MKGQGLANIIGAFFGGLPSTAVIARSSANVMSGARSRASAAFIVSGFTLASVLCLQPFLKQLPTCALSGVLVAIGIKMIINQETRTVLKVKDWTETLPMISAFLLLIFFDLLTGVAIGIAVSALILGLKRLFHKTPLNFRWTWLINSLPSGEGQLTGMELAGSLTFFSLSRTEEMIQRLHRKHNSGKMAKTFKIDCSKVVLMDLTSLEKLLTGLDDLTLHGYKIEMVYLPNKIKRVMLVVDPHSKKYFSSSHTLQTTYH